MQFQVPWCDFVSVVNLYSSYAPLPTAELVSVIVLSALRFIGLTAPSCVVDIFCLISLEHVGDAALSPCSGSHTCLLAGTHSRLSICLRCLLLR